MAHHYIHSTCSQDMTYPMYDPGSPRSMSASYRKCVTIKGGANVKDRYSLATPAGMVTEVTDQELEFLQRNEAFKRHVERGFMKVMDHERLDVSDLVKRDGAAQIDDATHATYSETTATAGLHDRFKGVRGVGFVA
ncbi:MAG: hypothetical protein MJZ81_07350 [Bacteroidales bacterium]|nr:hypothetical protein [Bacteroidales bacterium]